MVAHTFKLNPVEVAKQSDRFDIAVGLAAAELVIEWKHKAAEDAKNKQRKWVTVYARVRWGNH